MKKSELLVSFALIFMTCNLYSQGFTKGSTVGNLGLGFGWYGYGYGVSSLPAFSVSLEKGITDLENLGTISIGGIVGWKHASYDWGYSSFSDKWTWNDYILAARGALHLNTRNMEKTDFYGGAALGLRMERTSSNDFDGNKVSASVTRGLFAVYIGGRYFFSSQLAAFGELGYGLGYLTVGLSYKFQ